MMLYSERSLWRVAIATAIITGAAGLAIGIVLGRGMI